MEQIVPKRRHLQFIRRGTTQKKEYNIKYRDTECSAVKGTKPFELDTPLWTANSKPTFSCKMGKAMSSPHS